jgi:preprotein translocase subunit SecG
MSIFNYLVIISMALMTLLILVQTRGASLGAGLGGGGEVNTSRRFPNDHRDSNSFCNLAHFERNHKIG